MFKRNVKGWEFLLLLKLTAFESQFQLFVSFEAHTLGSNFQVESIQCSVQVNFDMNTAQKSRIFSSAHRYLYKFNGINWSILNFNKSKYDIKCYYYIKQIIFAFGF